MSFQKSDGGAIPHATTPNDLLNIMVAFAVATGDWEIVADNLVASNYIILKGLDYSGDKAIYVSIKRYANALTDTYGWMFQGYTGYTGAGFNSEPGAIVGQLPTLPLWNDEMPYWLSVNPRRIVLTVKVSGVYMSCYLGLMLPYGSTGQWQYPLVIGGTNMTDNPPTLVGRYSDITGTMTVPYIPAGNDAASNLVIRDSSGQWVRIYNTTKTITAPTTLLALTTAHGVSPYIDYLSEGAPNRQGWRSVRPNLDGDYPVRTLRVFRGDTPDCLGYLDGVKFIPGYLLSPEDTLTVGADDYTIFQNTFRADLHSFFVMQES